MYLFTFPGVGHGLAVVGKTLYPLKIQSGCPLQSRDGIEFLLLFKELGGSGGGVGRI